MAMEHPTSSPDSATHWLIGCATLVVTLSLAVQTGLADQRPNVVVILTDDQGWGDLSMNGNSNLNTPNIDQLSVDGASFDHFYVCPVCSPTRAEFLTGRYHPRSGVYSTSAGGERMNLDEMTIAETFKKAGYATAAFGKWHNGMQYPYHPNGRGFDEYYGFCSGHWGDYFSPPLEHNGRLVKGDGFVIDDFTNRAIDFIESNKEQPFFVYLPYNTPHSPMQVPDRWWNQFKDKELQMHHREPDKEKLGHVRAALAMCENIDWNVGRLLNKLDELELAEDTIVVYFCDNGPNGSRWNGGMKGRKGSTDEGGVRSPLLMRWPGRIAGGKKVERISAAIDLLPTLSALAGIDVASTKPLDGINLAPLIARHTDANASDVGNDRQIYSHWNGKVSLRTQRFRLDHTGQLFDIVKDPGQYEDVSAEFPELTARLAADKEQWSTELLADLRNDQRAFLIGHPGSVYTQIPARDGIAHGNIVRSNRFPNCSYFLNWTSVDDRITWDAEVVEEGDFDVEVYYACPEDDTGSTIELSFGDQSITGKVDQANDPPLRGGENDRVERTESYVKDFKPMKLGTIHLDQGPGTLTLRAIEKPGAQVMEFRLMMLKRVN